ncbi:SDR family oxidoreductase [Nocardiopsis tropica]|uniref:NAD(P)H-binding protein n=1 Tax=Nocardiopsis tropica TaxID=109330 RepID=A0ABV1ZN97_9ACTN
MTFLVAGATGTVGRHVVDQLLGAGLPVRALTRDPGRARLPEGARAVRGDLTDPDSLVPHLEGVVGLHLITFGGDDYAPLDTAPRIVELAERAGVRRVTVLCDFHPGPVEEALAASPLSWTLLHPVEFMANTLDWAGSVAEEGVVREVRTHPSALVHEADIASVAVTALTEDGHGGRAYPLTGPEALTPGERVAVLSRAVGRDIALVRTSPEEEAGRLRALGHDEEYIGFAARLAADPPEVGTRPLPTVEEVTGRPARGFAAWAEEHRDAFLGRG